MRLMLRAYGVYDGVDAVHEFYDSGIKSAGHCRVFSDLPKRLRDKMKFCIGNFFAPGRGRGPWDTAGGLLARAARRENNRTDVKGNKMPIPDAYKLYDFAKERLEEMWRNDSRPEPAVHPITKRHYLWVPQAFVDEVREALDAEFGLPDCVPLPEHHRVMCVKSSELDQVVEYRERSCYCAKCVAAKWHLCKESAKGFYTAKFCIHE
eukprot:gene48156-24301_t